MNRKGPAQVKQVLARKSHGVKPGIEEKERISIPVSGTVRVDLVGVIAEVVKSRHLD